MTKDKCRGRPTIVLGIGDLGVPGIGWDGRNFSLLGWYIVLGEVYGVGFGARGCGVVRLGGLGRNFWF